MKTTQQRLLWCPLQPYFSHEQPGLSTSVEGFASSQSSALFFLF